MTAVADSSSLHYLVLIDTSHILPDLFGGVLIPEAVSRELQSSGTPQKVREWMSHRPSWLEVTRPASSLDGKGLESLGAGEREAIALAAEVGPETLLLMDETRGRREAKRRQIRCMGTLGILDAAAARGLLDLPSAIERLLETTFYVTPDLWRVLLENDARRRGALPK